MSIGKALKLIREYHGLSQKDVAKKLQVSNTWISEIEKGSKLPTIELLEKYGEFFSLFVSGIFLIAEHIERGHLLTVESKAMAIIEMYMLRRKD